jgi:hypothetical protein
MHLGPTGEDPRRAIDRAEEGPGLAEEPAPLAEVAGQGLRLSVTQI